MPFQVVYKDKHGNWFNVPFSKYSTKKEAEKYQRRLKLNYPKTQFSVWKAKAKKRKRKR